MDAGRTHDIQVRHTSVLEGANAMKPGRPCSKAGCYRLSPCAVHPPRKPFATAIARSSLYNTSRWKKLRAIHLSREPLCRHCLIEGKRTIAKVVDHTIQHRNNPDLFWDETNLASLCWPHSNAKTGRETHNAPDPYLTKPTPQPPPYEYTLVTGPPCSGKTTYILNHIGEGDVMVDFDRIGQAISPTSPNYDYPQHIRDIVRAMRVTAIRCMEETRPNAHLWVIDTALDNHQQAVERYRSHGATVVELDPGIDVCLERAKAERPARIADIIRQWYGVGG